MIRPVFLSILFTLLLAICARSQTPAPSPPASAWNALSSPAMDPSKSAHTGNVEIVRDRIHITLLDGTIQFAQAANGVVFGATFHGKGRVQVDPPNPIEAQQLRLFTKQDKLDMPFTDGTFSFTDELFDEVAKQVKWQPSGATSDDLYANRQKTREYLGEAAVPRLLQGILSADRARTAYFLADLKVAGKDWVEFHYDALDPEEIKVGRWVDVGPLKLDDTWMHFPAHNQSSADALKDPLAKEDFVIRVYSISASVTSGAELSATTKMTLAPRLAGQIVLIFDFDSNLRVESVKDAQGTALSFYQARETKDRYQSYGDYVAVILSEPLAPGKPQTLEFRYSGKRAIRKAGNGNYFCETDFDMTFRSPKNSVLVATGAKTSDTVDGGTRITTWRSEIPLAVAGFAYGDYKTYNDKAGDVTVDVYANREPDDLMAMVQRAFESGAIQGAVGTLTPSAMAKTMGGEMANTVRLFSSYFGPFPYKSLSVASIPLSYSHGQQRHMIGLKDGPELTDFFRKKKTFARRTCAGTPAARSVRFGWAFGLDHLNPMVGLIRISCIPRALMCCTCCRCNCGTGEALIRITISRI